MFHIYTTHGFLTFSRGMEMKHWAKMSEVLVSGMDNRALPKTPQTLKIESFATTVSGFLPLAIGSYYCYTISKAVHLRCFWGPGYRCERVIVMVLSQKTLLQNSYEDIQTTWKLS